jgi:hypothetical protein
VIIQTYDSRPDLTDQSHCEPEAQWFTDGSSFVLCGERKVGYTVVSHKEVIETQPLPAGTSAQKVELIPLIRALTLGKGKRLNIYSDSTYAFLVSYAHAAIWKKSVLLSRRESPTKHGREILQLNSIYI